MTDDCLKARNVTVEFSGLVALDDVSLILAPGEIVGLIGPNGSGKTTLVNAITGHVKVSRGTIVAAGKTISVLKPRQIAHHGISRSFQIVRLFNNMTVKENVEVAALAHGETRADARRLTHELCEAMGIWSYRDELAATLSYGDKRRVEMARALATRPRFLLLDEPAAGMNDAETATLLETLAQIPAEKGLGLLIIDHDMDLMTRLCHRLHALASGRTIAEGPPGEVISHPEVVDAYLGKGAVHA